MANTKIVIKFDRELTERQQRGVQRALVSLFNDSLESNVVVDTIKEIIKVIPDTTIKAKGGAQGEIEVTIKQPKEKPTPTPSQGPKQTGPKPQTGPKQTGPKPGPKRR